MTIPKVKIRQSLNNLATITQQEPSVIENLNDNIMKKPLDYALHYKLGKICRSKDDTNVPTSYVLNHQAKNGSNDLITKCDSTSKNNSASNDDFDKQNNNTITSECNKRLNANKVSATCH